MARVGADRSELVRALGAVADSPEAARTAGRALRLDPVSEAEHTDVFVLNLPPYASVYLGPDGALGGEGADRAAGFWRALGLSPPAEPDHLAALLSLYASLGEARLTARRPAARAALSRAQATLFWEHLHSWLPAYLDAVTDLPAPALSEWAGLLRRVISAEAGRWPASPALPAALRAAPAAPGPDTGLLELADLLMTPVRSGVIITRRRLALGAGQAGVGHRIGERRFTLRAMLEQDPPATRAWLAAEADRWQQRHESRAAADQAARWWAGRARRTGQVLRARPAGETFAAPRSAGLRECAPGDA
jgi:TorA maturation chaperone TorD